MTGRYADTVYDRNAPGQQRAGDPYLGNGSNEERLLTQALASLTAVDREAVRELAPVARGPLFPPRQLGPRTQAGLLDVLDVTRVYPDANAQFSGSYSGSSTPALGWW